MTYAADLPQTAHCGDPITLSAAANGTAAVRGCRYSFGEPATTVDIAPDKDGSFVFDMPAQDITVEAITGELHSVNVDGDIANGSLAVSASEAAQGRVVTVTAAAAEGYKPGAITYTADGAATPVTVSVDENGETEYTFVMPDENTTVSAVFIADAVLASALDSVSGNAVPELGKNEALLGITVDDATALKLKAAAEAVNVNLSAQGGRALADGEKSSAVEALAQAGMIVVESDGDNISVKTVDGSNAEIRVVEKTYLEVEVKGYEQSGDSLTMTLNITPMRQTVATAEAEGAQLSSDNSVPLSQTQAVAVTAATRVTAGVPSEMALAAGGARSTVYVRHTHNGKTYEYPAVISGNAADGYTATFDNPNGYSEFTLGVQSGAVASYVYNGVTYRYTSFAEAISDALRKYVTTLTLYKMPSGEDYATVTKPVTFTFSVADGCEDLVDLDKLYTDWLLEDDGIVKASSAEQLAEHKIRFALTSYEIGDVDLDGIVDICDVTAIQRHIAELEPLSGQALALADTNGDGEIDISDATHLQMYLAEYDVVLGKQPA